MPQFVSEPIVAAAGEFDTQAMSRGEPSLPPSFAWHDRTLTVGKMLRSWRSYKDDRGDQYLKRHWFEFELTEGGTAVVYFDRGALRGAPRWYLYTIAPAT